MIDVYLVKIIIVILFIGYLYRGREAYLAALQSRGWPKTEASIISSKKVFEHNSYSPKIVYNYHVGGSQFEGEVYSILGSPIIGAEKYSVKISQKFTEGMNINIYYDPDNPDHSTIIPGFKLFQLIDFLLCYIPFVAIFFYI